MWTRRQWMKTTLASAAALPFASPGSAWARGAADVARIRGVRMALQSASFSFSGKALPDIFETMQALGLQEIDIMSEHIEHALGAPGIQLPGAGRPGPWARRAPRRRPVPRSAAWIPPCARRCAPGASASTCRSSAT